MNNLHRLFTTSYRLPVILLCIFVGSTLASKGDPISIPNFSFEAPAEPQQTATDATILPGWTFNDYGSGDFGSASIASNFGSAGTSDGSNYAFIDSTNAFEGGTITSAESLGTIASDTTYTLTLALGSPAGSDLSKDGGQVTFGLMANGVTFATSSIPNGFIPEGSFEDFTLTYTTGDSDPLAGQNLQIQLGTLSFGADPYQTAFDNVRLHATDVSAAPEPSAWAMLGSGLLLLGWRMRRHLAVGI